MSAHAKYAPSSADRWMACPGSVPLTEKMHVVPQVHSEYTASGTIIHEMGELLLTGKAALAGVSWGDYLADLPADLAEREVTPDMLDMASEYREAVNALRLPGDTMMVEVRSRHSDALFGTADCVLVQGDHLIVIDLKTGAGNMVSPIENKQLMTYAGMVMLGLDAAPKTVSLVIIQPPDDQVVKVWETDSDTIEAHMAAVEQAMTEDHLSAGAHCHWCPVAPVCTVKREMALNAASMSLDGLTPEQWGEALELANQLAPWIKVVNSRVHDLAVNAGLTIPGYKLVQKYGRKTWLSNSRAAFALQSYEAFNPRTLRTPTQLAKELPEVSDLIEELSYKPDRGLALVPESSKGEAVESGTNLIEAASQLALFQ